MSQPVLPPDHSLHQAQHLEPSGPVITGSREKMEGHDCTRANYGIEEARLEARVRGPLGGAQDQTHLSAPATDQEPQDLQSWSSGHRTPQSVP